MTSTIPNTDPTTTPSAPRLRLAAPAILLLLVLLGIAGPVTAQNPCNQPGQNMQCTEFGTIQMDSQRDIRGDTIDLVATVTLNTVYADHAARWLLFSIRNVTDDGTNPVTISMTAFATSAGDIVTTRVEQPSAHELNLWVDTLDAPVGTPITLRMQIGSTERGAYRLETLVMAFDRGYAPIVDASGHDASLFSFTLLGVNKETAGVGTDSGSIMDGHKLPGFGTVPVLVVAVALAAISRRRSA